MRIHRLAVRGEVACALGARCGRSLTCGRRSERHARQPTRQQWQGSLALEVNENKEYSNPIKRFAPALRRDAAAAVANARAISPWPKTLGHGRVRSPDARRERATGLDRSPGTPQG